MTVEFHILGKLKAKNPTVVVGLPGTGLVGSIAASYLVDSFDFEFIGYITSPEFAPLASIHNFRPYPPARIHYSKRNNLVVILSEMSIPISVSGDLAKQILKFAKSVKASKIISLGGISLKGNPKDVFVVSSNEKIASQLLGTKKFKPIKEGATTGVTGVLLTQGVVEKYPVVLFLGEANEDYMDPGASANVLKALSFYIGTDIDTKKLDKEAEEIMAELRTSLVKSKTVKRGREGFGGMYG
ncbi:proteasome assembly chaperone family protein [Candidatus Micrarchaeota archaeon]|nr:proteasome assembly chaperone family protein [Candidatus Micrarchaeota archaeon]